MHVLLCLVVLEMLKPAVVVRVFCLFVQAAIGFLCTATVPGGFNCPARRAPEHGERQLQYLYVQGQEPTLLATLEHLFSYAIGGGLEDRVYG